MNLDLIKRFQDGDGPTNHTELRVHKHSLSLVAQKNVSPVISVEIVEQLSSTAVAF